MEDFLKNNYSLLTNSFILVAVLAGLISYKKYRQATATFFIKIIIYLFLIELIGSYAFYYNKFEFLKPIYNSVFRQNYWWYTLTFDILTIVLFSILFQKILNSTTHRKILKVITISFIVFAILYLIFNRHLFFFQFFPVIQIIGGLIIITCSVLYFLEILQNNQVFKFYQSIYFYISISIFVWWIITTPLTFYDLYFKNEDWKFIILQWQIYLFANFFMYATFAIGLIVSKPEKEFN